MNYFKKFRMSNILDGTMDSKRKKFISGGQYVFQKILNSVEKV